MVINRNSSHYKWYTLGLDLLTKISGEDPESDWRFNYNNKHKDNTNLCHYMRTILFYTPSAVLATPVTIITALFAAIIYPISISGVGVTLATYLGAALTIGAFVGVIGGLVWLEDTREDRTRAAHNRGETTFWEVVTAWGDAKHRKICPLIEFPKEEEEEGETS